MITKRQRECLAIVARGQMNGLVPSFDEIKYEMNLKSRSGINKFMVGLEERGAIIRISDKPRSTELTAKGWRWLRIGNNICPCCNQEIKNDT